MEQWKDMESKNGAKGRAFNAVPSMVRERSRRSEAGLSESAKHQPKYSASGFNC